MQTPNTTPPPAKSAVVFLQLFSMLCGLVLRSEVVANPLPGLFVSTAHPGLSELFEASPSPGN